MGGSFFLTEAVKVKNEVGDSNGQFKAKAGGPGSNKRPEVFNMEQELEVRAPVRRG